MNAFWKDLKFTLRSLGRRPGFTAAIVLTLALGIGAHAAIFSFVNALLVRSMPFESPDRLVRLHSVRGGEAGRLSIREIEDLNERLTIFEDVATYVAEAAYNLSSDGEPEEVPATLVSGNLFDLLGTELLHGAPWPEEFDYRRSFGIVLSYDLWQRRYGGDPGVIGQQMTMDGASDYVIYGVLPEGFQFPDRAAVYRSRAITPRQIEDRTYRGVFGLARLKPGVSYTEAQAAVDAVSRELAQEFPETNAHLGIRLVPVKESFIADVRPYLLLLLGAVSLLLLIACVNVVNLLLVRAIGRDKEIAVRSALGARSGQIARHFLVESVLLAVAGCGLGLALAYGGVAQLREMIRVEMPDWMRVEVDGTVLVFALGLAVGIGLLVGLMPALQVKRLNVGQVLKEGRSVTGGRRRHFRNVLVVAEIALAVVLLIGSALMVQSFQKLRQAHLGFEPEQVLTFRTALGWRAYTEADDTRRFYRETLHRLAALPGVTAVGANENLPLSGEEDTHQDTFTLEGQSPEAQQQNPYINLHRPSVGYFEAMRIPIRQGRVFTDFDVADTVPVALVSERLAERLWPGKNPLDQRIKLGGPDRQGPWRQVVGVVGNVKHEALQAEEGYDLYISPEQFPSHNAYFVLRTTGPPMRLAEAATQVVWAVDPLQSTFDFQTMEDRIAAKVWQERISSTLFSAFAVLAALLAAVGIYSVMAYAVSRRTREIGIRMALGADPRDVLRLVLGEAVRMAGLGVAIGVGVAFVLTQAMAGVLHGIGTADPATFAGVSLLLALVAMGAAFLPAYRAARIRPIWALRQEV